MELSKDDIKHIAYHRFNKRHPKRFYGIVFGGLALLMGLVLPLSKYGPESEGLALAVAILIGLLMLVGLYFLYIKPQGEYAKSFVEECEANPTFTYVLEVAKDAQKVIS